jgi:pimeloyl-ACP methyl ester carboxylesterase
MLRKASAVLSALLAFAAVPALADTLPRAEPLDTCFVDLPDDFDLKAETDCGYVAVPQSRKEGASGEIRLAYTRLRARGGTTRAPLFMLAGGPGQAMLGEASIYQLFQQSLLGPVLDSRDVVLMEQRGTLRARPYLDCPDFWSLSHEMAEKGEHGAEDYSVLSERLLTCVARHEAAGTDLAAYNNIENAADVNDMRAALGYGKILYYGESYGTELGQHVMRDFPDILEAVILDGTGALSVTDWSAGQARNAQWGIDNLVDICRKDAGCAADYDIPALLDAALAHFDGGPIASRFTAPDGSGVVFDLELTAEGFASYLHGLQTSKYGVAIFPALLNAYVNEGRDRIAADMTAQTGARLLADPAAQDAEMALLVHLAMVCSDDPPRSLDDVVVDGFSRYEVLFARSSARLYVEMCAALDLPQLPASADQPVVSDVPALVLSGGLDIQTPYFVAQGVADHLSRARHVIFPTGFHVQVMNINPCAIRIVCDFVTDPFAEPDLSCAADHETLPFMRPDFTMPEAQ